MAGRRTKMFVRRKLLKRANEMSGFIGKRERERAGLSLFALKKKNSVAFAVCLLKFRIGETRGGSMLIREFFCWT